MGVIAEAHGDLKNHPLVYTLFMLRFPIQKILNDVVPSIQDALKKEYPIYEERIQQSIEIAQGKDGQTISTAAVSEHLFFDSERKQGILIKNDRLVFHSPIYSGFEQFNSSFISVLEVVIKALSLTHYESLGIRYVDAIIPDYDKGESLDDLLQSSLLSFEFKNDDISSCLSSRQISHYQTEEGVLILKVNLLQGGEDSIPPDLRNLSSLLRFDEATKKGTFAVLDFDHGFTAPDNTVVEIDLDIIADKSSKMHDITSRAFLAVINEGKIGKWK